MLYMTEDAPACIFASWNRQCPQTNIQAYFCNQWTCYCWYIHVYEAAFLFQVTPGGKADLSQAIAVGDEIVAVNGIECQSRAEAIELVRCSRQKLNIALKR